MTDLHGDAAHLSNKRRLHPLLCALAETHVDDLGSVLSKLYTDDAEWRGSHPLNELKGRDSIHQSVWRPLLSACPDLERRDDIVVAGAYEGRDYIATVGHYCGRFERPWLGIPLSGSTAYLRYGEVHQIKDGLIVQSTCLWDLLDLMRQAGYWPLPPSLGLEGRWSGPYGGNGVVMWETDAEESARSLEQTLAMHATLAAFDDRADLSAKALLQMPQKQHWHPRMMWFGPSGIGTTRGLDGFVLQHQLPFRIAFPERKAGDQWNTLPEKTQLGGGHYIRIGDGPFSVTGGWPSVFAVHTGADWLGLPPTGRPVGMRVMDFYFHHEEKIRDNWVPLDIIHVLLQLGVDVFARMASHFGSRRHSVDNRS